MREPLDGVPFDARELARHADLILDVGVNAASGQLLLVLSDDRGAIIRIESPPSEEAYAGLDDARAALARETS